MATMVTSHSFKFGEHLTGDDGFTGHNRSPASPSSPAVLNRELRSAGRTGDNPKIINPGIHLDKHTRIPRLPLSPRYQDTSNQQ
jgi:hypothetical protein